MFYKNFPVSGFELWTSGIGSDRSANWATTTAQMTLNITFQISTGSEGGIAIEAAKLI